MPSLEETNEKFGVTFEESTEALLSVRCTPANFAADATWLEADDASKALPCPSIAVELTVLVRGLAKMEPRLKAASLTVIDDI
mmetsp:Transcript_137550/g.274443  ORF Transcript_137550/g.274443 Transcript_137550/m.274443 type:complete len:83 (+) Transcript_137550:2249-2497(+)